MKAERSQNTSPAADGKADTQKKFTSTIQFPYGDLDDAIEFARAVHSVGGQACSVDQVAGYLKQSPHSGAFRLRSSFPRVFGLTESERGIGGIKLTPLGMRMLDPQREPAARVEAFLHVPLYKAIFDKYKGYTLPPAAALEREMALLGVSPKQTDKARQVFERAAKQAGFTWAGPDRLVMPVLKDGDEGIAPQPAEPRPLEKGTPGAAAKSPMVGGGGGPPDRTDRKSVV